VVVDDGLPVRSSLDPSDAEVDLFLILSVSSDVGGQSTVRVLSQ